MCNLKTESLYGRLFARFYDRFMNRAEKVILQRRRRRLLKDLTGDILEVGSGTGINFPLYPSAARVTAAEPSAAMMREAEARLEREKALVLARITFVDAGVGDEKLGSMFGEGAFDAAVCTLVLCTIPDPVFAIQFLKSRIKPGGRLVVLEHVRAHTGPGRLLQKALNPAWRVFAQGCNLNRDTESLIKGAGFRLIAEESFHVAMPFYQGVFERP